MLSLAEFDERGVRIRFRPGKSSEVANIFNGRQHEGESSSDEDMPGTLCCDAS